MATPSLLQTFQLEHLPPHHTLHIALFRNTKNATFLHQQLLAGNTSYEYAFIDANVILSKIHVLAAAFRAVNDFLANRLRSRNVHSEIVFSLSPNNNIAESFRRFGISPTTSNLLVVKLSTPSTPHSAAEVQAHLSEVVEGEQVEFEDEVIQSMTDLERVKKIYKLNSGGGGGSKKREVNGAKEGEEKKEMEVLVLGAMALRGSTN